MMTFFSKNGLDPFNYENICEGVKEIFLLSYKHTAIYHLMEMLRHGQYLRKSINASGMFCSLTQCKQSEPIWVEFKVAQFQSHKVQGYAAT